MYIDMCIFRCRFFESGHVSKKETTICDMVTQANRKMIGIPGHYIYINISIHINILFFQIYIHLYTHICIYMSR